MKSSRRALAFSNFIKPSIDGFNYYIPSTMMNAIEISRSIKKIAEVKISLDPQTKDFQFNGFVPNNIPSNHYSALISEYETKLRIQLRENCTVELIEKYLSELSSQTEKIKKAKENHRVAFLFAKNKGQLSEMADATHERIQLILDFLLGLLGKWASQLRDIAEYRDFALSSDFKDAVAETMGEKSLLAKNDSGKTEFTSTETNMVLPKSAKAIFNMSKKEVILFFYVLEKAGMISFESPVQRNLFIEENFKYTELRNTKGKNKSFDITDVNRDISILKGQDRKSLDANKKAKENFIFKLHEKLSGVNFRS